MSPPVSSTPQPRHAPIVLIPGLRGIVGGQRRTYTREYFPGVGPYLMSQGYQVHLANLSPTASIAKRARELDEILTREVGHSRVHLIGHSLGGLDGRYLISVLGQAERILSLTTIGTPHRGTPFADWMITKFSHMFCPILRAVRMSYDAYFDLTTSACQQFNADVRNVPSVRYFSVAGVCEGRWLGPEWRVPARIVARHEGPNDGVVSVASATWGEHTEVWTGDHLNLVNRPNRIMRRDGAWFDRSADYGRLIGRLAAIE